MSLLSASDLAAALGVSKVRVSQLTSAGRLDGCWSGEGRQRRYDLHKVAAQLGRNLHPGQAMGNGAQTKSRIQEILAARDQDDDDAEPAPPPPRRDVPRDGGELTPRDPDRYELARTQKAEEEARRLRRQNAEAEGTFVLASEVQRQTARLLAQEIAEIEAVLRDGARRVADKLGVDFKAVRQILMEEWRAHRGKRTEQLAAQAETAAMTPAEIEADI